ncbi:hypothetical protein HanHA300_Chr05g0178421 [Helianthus annuus]|nr:hypothetical protein HanHA300_Chr05g0178421 [Helianthus annuus]KAJ0584821.1 hypothetical protein HanHA89_Chr05g0193141 [Helianthus annuus]KAJ0750484.1 hypothetical protein HanLR1_Chr05g0182481 [Helianthus annuus]
MRLEQAAAAFVKGDIKSHGAFAILQGRHMKYCFIRGNGTLLLSLHK